MNTSIVFGIELQFQRELTLEEHNALSNAAVTGVLAEMNRRGLAPEYFTHCPVVERKSPPSWENANESRR